MGWWFSCEGVVAAKFSLESLSSLGFEEMNPGCPGNFAGMSQTPGGVQKVCAKKVRARFSFPTQGEAAPRPSLFRAVRQFVWNRLERPISEHFRCFKSKP